MSHLSRRGVASRQTTCGSGTAPLPGARRLDGGVQTASTQTLNLDDLIAPVLTDVQRDVAGLGVVQDLPLDIGEHGGGQVVEVESLR